MPHDWIWLSPRTRLFADRRSCDAANRRTSPSRSSDRQFQSRWSWPQLIRPITFPLVGEGARREEVGPRHTDQPPAPVTRLFARYDELTAGRESTPAPPRSTTRAGLLVGFTPVPWRRSLPVQNPKSKPDRHRHNHPVGHTDHEELEPHAIPIVAIGRKTEFIPFSCAGRLSASHRSAPETWNWQLATGNSRLVLNAFLHQRDVDTNRIRVSVPCRPRPGDERCTGRLSDKQVLWTRGPARYSYQQPGIVFGATDGDCHHTAHHKDPGVCGGSAHVSPGTASA